AADRITGCPAQRGRPDGAILRRGKPGQVASGAHHVVLRDLYPYTSASELPRFRSAVPRPLQFLLQRCGAAAGKSTAQRFFRPNLDEVEKYRQYVDQHMQELLSASAVSDEVLQLVELGLNHEQQHQELLITDIKHAFWSNPLRPAYQSGATSPFGSTAQQKAKGFPGGLLEIGAD